MLMASWALLIVESSPGWAVPRDGLVTIPSGATVGRVDLGSVTLKREGDLVSSWIFEDKV